MEWLAPAKIVLLAKVGTLPEELRRVLECKYGGEMSLNAAAELLCISYATAWEMHSRALKLLHEQLKDDIVIREYFEAIGCQSGKLTPTNVASENR